MKLLKLVILTITLPWFSQVAYATSTSATINIKLCSDLDNSAGKGPFFRCTFQCNDGIDNDDDGLIDFPADGGCSSATDNSEINTGGGSSGGGGGTTGVGPGPTSPAPAPVSSSGGFNPFFAPDPFDRLPRATSTDPLIARLTLGSFTFSQVGEALQNFNEQGYIRINGNKYLTVSLAADQVPDVLKTIGITVFDAADYQRSFSFVLRADDAKLAYAATVAPFGQNGIYPINIHILNYQDQSLKKLSGFLQVSGVGFLPVQAVTDLFAHVAPLAVTSGLLAGASGALAAGSSIGSIYDLYLILLRAFSAIGSFFGRGRKRKPWGTVYDSVTKRPLDPAYVSVRERGREIATAITDIDGRYSLFLPAGTYEIVVNKTHYKFPSTILAGKDHDELYDHLYHGGPVVAGGAEITALNIPLDQVGFDWNEFIKESLFHPYWSWRRIVPSILRIVYGVGFVIALVALAVLPGWFNLGVLALYFGIYLLGRRRFTYSKLVTIRRQISGEPIPFAIVRVFLEGVAKEVKTLVADRDGRIYVLVRPGRYYLTVDRKQPDGSYYTFHKTEVKNLSTGLWKSDVIVPQYKEE